MNAGSRMLLVGSLLASACSQSSERGRPTPHDATASFRVIGGETYHGAFVLSVGPGERAQFDFSGHSETSGDNLTGMYSLTAEDMSRSVNEDRWIVYTPTDEWEWLFENRGSFNIMGTDVARYAIRTFQYRETSEGIIAVQFEGVHDSQIDAETRTIRSEGGAIVEVEGRLIGTCWTEGPGGSVMEDPGMVANPFCRELLSPP